MIPLIQLVAILDLLIGLVIAIAVIAELADFATRDRGDFQEFSGRVGLRRWDDITTWVLCLLLGISSLVSSAAAVLHLPTRGLRSKLLSSFWLAATALIAALLLVHLCTVMLNAAHYGLVVVVVTVLSACILLNGSCCLLVRRRTFSRIRDSYEEPQPYN